MSEQYGEVHSIQNPPDELSVKDLQDKKSYYNNKKKKILRVQTSKPPKDSIKIRPLRISIHYTWALVLTVLCFFVIGPCWALYKIRELRRMIARKEFEAAVILSHKISTVLVISTILGVFAWVSFLFCSVGLLLTGVLIKKHFI